MMIYVLEVLSLSYPQYIYLVISNELYGPRAQDRLILKLRGWIKKPMDYVYVTQGGLGKTFREHVLFGREYMW